MAENRFWRKFWLFKRRPYNKIYLSARLRSSDPRMPLKILWISVKFDGNLHSTSIGGWFKWWPSGSSRKRPLLLIPCRANWKQDFSEADRLCNSSTFSLNFSFSTSFCCKVLNKDIRILCASLNNAFTFLRLVLKEFSLNNIV